MDGLVGISLYLFQYAKYKDSLKVKKYAKDFLIEIFSILNANPDIIGSRRRVSSFANVSELYFCFGAFAFLI